jgi:hypothetical protein
MLTGNMGGDACRAEGIGGTTCCTGSMNAVPGSECAQGELRSRLRPARLRPCGGVARHWYHDCPTLLQRHPGCGLAEPRPPRGATLCRRLRRLAPAADRASATHHRLALIPIHVALRACKEQLALGLDPVPLMTPVRIRSGDLEGSSGNSLVRDCFVDVDDRLLLRGRAQEAEDRNPLAA